MNYRHLSPHSVVWQMYQPVHQWAREEHPPHSMEDHLPLCQLVYFVSQQQWSGKQRNDEREENLKLGTSQSHMEAVYLLWPIDQETQWTQVSGSAHVHITASISLGLEEELLQVRCAAAKDQSLACILNISFFFILLALVGVKKIRNPERMVRIAVGYTGHAPPKSDDTDGNSKRHSNDLHTCLCMC